MGDHQLVLNGDPMKWFFILLIAALITLNFSLYSHAHPGHGYYIEEPSDSGETTADSSSSDSESVNNPSKTGESGTADTRYTEASSHDSSSDSASSGTSEEIEVKNSSQLNQTSACNNSTETDNYGFIPAIAGLCLVFGLTAFRFPRDKGQ